MSTHSSDLSRASTTSSQSTATLHSAFRDETGLPSSTVHACEVEEIKHELKSAATAAATDPEKNAGGGGGGAPLGLVRTAISRIASRSAHDNSPPPDGGLQAWTIVLFAHFSCFCTWGFLNAFGILQTHYVTALGRPQSDVSWIGSVQSFLLFALSTLSGRASDSGYFRQTYALGTFLLLLGIFTASAATTYWQVLLSHGICCGVGGGLVFCPSFSVCATYFKAKQGLVLAMCAAATSLGGLVFGTVLQQLLPRIGFPWTMRVIGFLVMAMLVPANFVIKPRKLARNLGPMVDLEAFKEPPYLLFTIGMFFIFMGLFFPFYYIGSFGRNVVGVSSAKANTLVMIINGVGVAGRIAPASLVHLTGPMNLLIPLTVATGITIVAWAAVRTELSLTVFDVFFGFVLSAGQGMFPPALGSLTSDMSKMGVRNGMCFSIIAFACLVGPPVGGALIQVHGGGYLYAQLYAGLSMLVGVGFVAAARIAKVGTKLRCKT